jgi:hypothetical protein
VKASAVSVPRTAARLAPWLGACLLLPAAGCSESRVAAPRLSPEEAGKQALAAYDANGDGVLDEAELEKCPALKSCLTILDTDGDGRLSADEIAARVAAYQESKIGLAAFACQVTLDGRPLEGATVTLVPETFLGPGLKKASGVSDAQGWVRMQTEGAVVPGVACGLYRVEASKKDADGEEAIPASYNTQTVLGVEVAPDTQARRGVLVFALRSK